MIGGVKYNPVAAGDIVTNNLFSTRALNQLLLAGKTAIPPFESKAISLKPAWIILDQSALQGGQYYMLPAWPGPPNPAKAFPPEDWHQCVWVDTKDPKAGPGTGKVDTICMTDGTSRTAATTYGMERFIQFQLSASQARAVNAVRDASRGRHAGFAVEGNYAVLAGMHVTTREITRWTWQTFWWSPDPDSPNLPSSKAVAAERPTQLKGAARNYSQASSYSMVFPPQPNTGGSNTGDSVYAYNPWLEATFGPNDLPASVAGKYQGKPVPNNVGVQTNCMSCHAQASYPLKVNSDGIRSLYTGDQYIDLNGPQFKGALKADFLWTIPDDAQP